MASKFTMVDPTLGDDVFATMAQTVNDRMGKAVEELAEKHKGGRAVEETSVDGPTGQAYRAAEAAELKRAAVAAKRAKEAEEKAVQEHRENEIVQQLQAQGLSDDEDDDSDEDVELKRIREKRMNEIKAAHREKMENLSKGHGQYREITQDEFLPEVTSSKNVICHFYHREFMRCKIIDKHLALLAPNHVEAKFVKINAEKAPFFVSKLNIRTLPTIVLFVDGVAKEQVRGFESFAGKMREDKIDEFPTSMLASYIAKFGVINYVAPPTRDELHKFQLGGARGPISAGISAASDDDLSD